MKKRFLSILLTLCMVFTLFSQTAYSEEAEEAIFSDVSLSTNSSGTTGTASQCKEHKEHNKDCGYIEAVTAQPCGCLNEDGGYDCDPVLNEDNVATSSEAKYTCRHKDGCGYTVAVEGSACTHECVLCMEAEEVPVCNCTILCTPAPECICPPADNSELVHGEDCPLSTPETAEAHINPDCPVCSEGDTNLPLCKGAAQRMTRRAGSAVWDGTPSSVNQSAAYSGGRGTAAEPYKISNGADLAQLAANVNAGLNYSNGKYFKLTNNIDLGGKEWTPIGLDHVKFNGTFDGNNFEVHGLYINSTDNCQGLFGKADSSSVLKNLGVDGEVSGNNEVGGIVGNSLGTIQNCYSTGEVSGNISIGGIAGTSPSTGIIQNCYNTGSVSGNDFIGGIMGYSGASPSPGTIQNCYNTGSVSGNNFIGGITGYSVGTILNCYNTSSVSGNDYIGGIVGSASHNVQKCYNTGSVSGNDNIGGIVGVASENVQNCYNTGSVSGNDYIGGIGGNIFGNAQNFYNTGSISGNRFVGGMLGASFADASGISATVKNCVSLGGAISTSSDTTLDFARIMGSNEIFDCVSGDLIGNKARSDMPVLGELVTDGAADNINGADVIVGVNTEQSSVFDPAAFSEANGWNPITGKLETGAVLPTLKGFQTQQNPTLPEAEQPTSGTKVSTFADLDHAIKTGKMQIELTADISIPSGSTLTIPQGVTLTVSSGVSLTNEGTLIIEGTIINKGTIDNRAGTITGKDKITNSGSGTVVEKEVITDDSSNDSTTTPDKPNTPTQEETKADTRVEADGSVTITITSQNIIDAIAKAEAAARKNGTAANGITIVFRADGGAGAANVTINLAREVQDTIISKKVVNTIVVVDNPNVQINMDLNAITEVNRQAQTDVNISAIRMDNASLTGAAQAAIGSRPVFDLKVSYGDGKQVQSFGTGRISVSIPYTLGENEQAGLVCAIYVDEHGQTHWLTDSAYDNTAKVLRFTTSHFSAYGVGYRQDTPALNDIGSHPAKNDILFAVSRGLLGGTGSTAFSPDTAITKGVFATALGRLANADVSSYKQSSFTDVTADSYYMGYIEWASKNGIISGSNGKFMPDQGITREEMAVIMHSYAKATGLKSAQGTLPRVYVEKAFADSNHISSYAKEAVKAMQMAGIIRGKSGYQFDPKGTATRAEVSAVLRRFAELRISPDTAQGWTMNDSGKWMYYENGSAAIGTHNIGGISYSFDQNGELASGF